MEEFQKQLIANWKDHFDKIYCIQFLPKMGERRDRITNELKRVGIFDSGIFSWKNTYISPFQNVLQKNIQHRHKNTFQDIGAFNCAMAHYEIWKEALNFRFDRILVLEEDISFLKDLNSLNEVLELSPKTDIILYDHICNNQYSYRPESKDQSLYINKYYRSFNENCCWYGSAACYSLNLKALQILTEEQEKCFQPADEVWNNWGIKRLNTELTKSFSIKNLGVQKEFSSGVHSQDIINGYRLAEVNLNNYI